MVGVIKELNNDEELPRVIDIVEKMFSRISPPTRTLMLIFIYHIYLGRIVLRQMPANSPI